MPYDIHQLDQMIDNGMIKLEITGGIPTWEFSPTIRHQRALDRIRRSIQPAEGTSCSCYALADIYISFPDGSLKRPDISIFCTEPPEIDEALEVVPGAVIEILSHEAAAARKDLELNPPFYLSQGVRDVVTFDPRTNHIFWWDVDTGVDAPRQLTAPATLTLHCNCTVQIA